MTSSGPREFDIQTRFFRIAAKQWGPTDGIPTLALHGWLDNANTYDRLAPLLGQLRLIAIDLPGHGRSEHRPPGVHYHFVDYVDDVLAVADALEWERFVLMGHSMGGGVSTLFAATFPERLSRLILIEGFGAALRDMEGAPQAMRESVLNMARPPLSQQVDYASFDEVVAARAKVGRMSLASARLLVERSIARNENGMVWTRDQRLRLYTIQYYSNELMVTFIRRIQAPVLLVTGADGALKNWPYFESRRQAVQDLTWVDLPGNHHLHLEHPESVAEAIKGFTANKV